MKARENQGVQFALIVFVVLTIALSVATFVFFSKYEEECDKIAHLEQSIRKAETDTDAIATELKQVKTILGADAGDSLHDIEQAKARDFEVLPVGVANANHSYRDLARQLAITLAEKHGELIDGQRREDQLGDKIVVDERTQQHEIGQYHDNLDEASTQYLDERGKLMSDVDRAAKSKLAAQALIERRQSEFDQIVSQLRSNKQELDRTITILRAVNAGLFDRLNDEEVEWEVVDANVQWVSQRERMVWLNRGSEDGLRQQVTFKVIDRDESNPTLAKSKGSVEVIRVTGPHSAEARIVDDIPTNPILSGDKLFSAAWHAGRVEHFALTGFMDIDGDGQSDRELIKQLIARNHGVIDAEVTDEGTLVGEMTIDTKYLIEGSRPNDRSSADALKVHGQIRLQAREQSVKCLSVNKFLDYVGYRVGVRTVALDRRASPDDFPAKQPEVRRRGAGEVINFSPIRPESKRTTY